MIYLDHGATTKPAECVIQNMVEAAADSWGNPSAAYTFSDKGRKLCKQAQKMAATLLGGVSFEEIILTSGGTEGNNLCIKGAALAVAGMDYKKMHFVTTRVEHDSVLKCFAFLENMGADVTYLTPDRNGLIRAEAVYEALRPETVLVSVMYANNETGVILPIEQISEAVYRYGQETGHRCLFHTDAVQAVGHISIDLTKLVHVDLLTASAHKFYGPKSCGFVYCRNGVVLAPLMLGGGQQGGMRSGTLDPVNAAGLCAAISYSEAKLKEGEPQRLQALRDLFERRLQEKLPDIVIHGAVEKRLPGHSSIAFSGMSGESILAMLDLADIYVSSGSACSTGRGEPSHVLTAMGISKPMAEGTLRFTFGVENNGYDVQLVVDELTRIVLQLKTIIG